jgi:hypothetical protein
MENKINYDVDIDPSMLLLNLKQAVDEYQTINCRIIDVEIFIKHYIPVDYSKKDEVYEVTDTTIEGQQKLLDRYNRRMEELKNGLENISKILNELLSN